MYSLNTTTISIIITPPTRKQGSNYHSVQQKTTTRRSIPLCRASVSDNFGENHLFWMKNTSAGDGGAPSSSRKSHNSNGSSGKRKGGDKATKEIPVVYSHDGRLMAPTPLGAVVDDAVKRWYMEAERDAMRGDVKAMALLGQMLMEGYGCDVDVERGRQFAERARRRGYRMERVYCEI